MPNITDTTERAPSDLVNDYENTQYKNSNSSKIPKRTVGAFLFVNKCLMLIY